MLLGLQRSTSCLGLNRGEERTGELSDRGSSVLDGVADGGQGNCCQGNTGRTLADPEQINQLSIPPWTTDETLGATFMV